MQLHTNCKGEDMSRQKGPKVKSKTLNVFNANQSYSDHSLIIFAEIPGCHLNIGWKWSLISGGRGALVAGRK